MLRVLFNLFAFRGYIMLFLSWMTDRFFFFGKIDEWLLMIGSLLQKLFLISHREWKIQFLKYIALFIIYILFS